MKLELRMSISSHLNLEHEAQQGIKMPKDEIG